MPAAKTREVVHISVCRPGLTVGFVSVHKNTSSRKMEPHVKNVSRNIDYFVVTHA